MRTENAWVKFDKFDFRKIQNDFDTDSELLFTKCLSQMSYCPQNEALIDSLNAYDHLKLFARIKGVPNRYVESEVDRIVHLLGMFNFYEI